MALAWGALLGSWGPHARAIVRPSSSMRGFARGMYDFLPCVCRRSTVALVLLARTSKSSKAAAWEVACSSPAKG